MIDIIIPVHNTPINDLERCLNSILNQNFKDYLVYIINDGSTKKTKEYLDNYVNNKNNFKVIHVKNGGVSKARNTGINISNSKYLTFVDSDDTIEKDFLSESYKLIEDNNLDLIIGGYNEIYNDKVIKTRICMPGLHIYDSNNLDLFFEKLLSGKTQDSNKEIGDCPTGRIYTRLFRRKSIDNLRFNNDIKMSEDTLFMIDYMYNKPKIGIIDKIWYNYFKNEYSISNGTNKDELIKNINRFIDEIILRYQEENNSTIKNAYLLRVQKANNHIDMLKNKGKKHECI